MTVRGEDDGALASGGTESGSGHTRSGQRSVPERSRTLSSGELYSDKSRGTPTSGLPYGATAPNVLSQHSANISNMARPGPSSKSEDGHYSTRLHLYDPNGPSSPIPPLPSSSSQSTGTPCAACGSIVTGQFVRALGVVFHKACFTCNDCHSQVAQKFFPVDGPDGRQYPLCETDYFRRLGLLCANCGLALRGSYITACNKKYHIEHFVCSIPACGTLFGPSDSYYEHEDSVYCHFHYSTRFANKCAGCNTAILKQFVEVNRNMKEDCYHPECYLCHKFWNVKLYAGLRPNSSSIDDDSESSHHQPEAWLEEEQHENAKTLRSKQTRMEQQVYQIWTILSAFEESSAACISDMLKHVSDGQYLDAIRNAEKFILHVEVLFAAIDDLEYCFFVRGLKGMSHVREARVLCKKTVDLFTLLQKPNRNAGGMTQELLALVTGLAHYLKVLIRIALTAALKLDREHGKEDSIPLFLDSLNALLVRRGSTAAKRLTGPDDNNQDKDRDGAPKVKPPDSGVAGTTGVVFGYKSLTPEYAGESPFWPLANGRPPTATMPLSDVCISCSKTIEEDCIRLGTYQRWHNHCIKCHHCSKAAGEPLPPPKPRTVDEKEAGVRPSTVRRPPAPVGDFMFDLPNGEGAHATPSSSSLTLNGREGSGGFEVELVTSQPVAVWCLEHRHQSSISGFQPVTRLEQYAFLLNVALRRLYSLLKKSGVITEMPASTEAERQARRESSEITPIRSVHHLDRKLSATSRIPKRSTIIESPADNVAQAAATMTSSSQRSNEMQGYSHQHQRPALTAVSMSMMGQSQTAPIGYTGGQQQSQSQPPPPQGRGPPFLPHRQQSLQAMSPSSSAPPPSSPSTVGQVPAYGSSPRPTLPHTNTAIHIIDHPTPQPQPQQPQSPSYILPPDATGGAEDGITLADLPQFIEAAQNRSLPTSMRGGRQHIAELSQQELLLVKYAALLIIAKSPLGDQQMVEEMIEWLEAKKGGFWNKLFNKGDKKNVKKKGVFCIPLELLAEREGVDSMLGAAPVPLRVPSFIDDIVSAMKQMDMSVEGIFRKNGNIRRMNQVIELLDRDPASVDLSQDNPVQLAALLKRFMRDLPDPLLTHKLHRLWIMTQNIQDSRERLRLVHMVMLLLPRYHRDTLEVLLVFLKWVASFSHVDEETGSKMDLGNLATVITPSILKTNKRDGMRDDSFTGIRVVTELLEEQDELNLVPEEFMPLLHEQNYFTASFDQPRELLKKIDTFLRLRYGSSVSGSSANASSRNISTPSPAPGQGPNQGPNQGYYMPPPSSSRSNQNHEYPSPNTNFPVNGSHPQDRPMPNYNNDYAGKSLPPHPGLPHQAASSPHPTSRLQQQQQQQQQAMQQEYSNPPPRPSLDNFWAPPNIPSAGSASSDQSRRESPRSRPNSFLKPSSDSSPVFGSLPASRNSPLGA